MSKVMANRPQRTDAPANQTKSTAAPGTTTATASNASLLEQAAVAEHDPHALQGGFLSGLMPGTAVDGPGMTPPGKRVLGHQWVQSSELGNVKIEQDYGETGALKSAVTVLASNVLGDTDLDIAPEHPTRALRFSYTTQDRGELVEATGVMLVPMVEDGQDMPVLLTLHGFGGMNNDAAPSGGWDEGRNGTMKALGSVVASGGKIVVVPDYIGLNSNGDNPGQVHPALVAEPTAIASLDALRAARNLLAQMNASDGSGETPHTAARAGETVVWGGSQGGHAAAAVTRYQPSYAPDQPIAGYAMATAPLDLRAQLHKGIVEEKAVFNSAAIFMGMADWYGVPLDEVFRDTHSELLPVLFARHSGDELMEAIEERGLTMKDILQPDLYEAAKNPDFAGNSRWSQILGENSFPHSEAIPPSTGIPGHFTIAGDDQLVDQDTMRASYEAMIKDDEVLKFLECAGADHEQGSVRALDDGLNFLDDLLDGKELPIGMNTRLPAEDCWDYFPK